MVVSRKEASLGFDQLTGVTGGRLPPFITIKYWKVFWRSPITSGLQNSFRGDSFAGRLRNPANPCGSLNALLPTPINKTRANPRPIHITQNISTRKHTCHVPCQRTCVGCRYHVHVHESSQTYRGNVLDEREREGAPASHVYDPFTPSGELCRMRRTPRSPWFS